MKKVATFIKIIQTFGFVLLCFTIPVWYVFQLLGEIGNAALDYIFNAGKQLFNEPDSTSKNTQGQ